MPYFKWKPIHPLSEQRQPPDKPQWEHNQRVLRWRLHIAYLERELESLPPSRPGYRQFDRTRHDLALELKHSKRLLFRFQQGELWGKLPEPNDGKR